MAIMQDRRLKSTTPSLESFEETYKTAYSHGLETIYSLETVDLKKVRKIEDSAHEEDPLSVSNELPPEEESHPQWEFDFGHAYRGWVEPYFLGEPISTLSLSFQAASCLKEQGVVCIRDVFRLNFQECVTVKGMGQGHIDEIQKKLNSYISGRSIERAYTIDLRSLILNLSAPLSFKKLSLLLKGFRLEKFVPLSRSEKIELKTFNLSNHSSLNQSSWKEEVIDFFREDKIQKQFLKELEKITEVFIKPWMSMREGIATEDELTERFEKVTAQPEDAVNFLRFVKVMYTQESFPFSLYLKEVERGLFCCDKASHEAYSEVIALARSYFYRPDTVYSLEELTMFLLKEFAKEWKAYDAEKIQTFLKKSTIFQVFLGGSKEPEVRLA